eukprot:TRINITY_DN6284_c0_g1_i1.p1 TRINITY_DN6284_c0_g1~~TRINITY_DN6284_c0_g1_i1.p1  ORF type:complete len:695 (+),score=115.50 TRINITY_DN6284_c0_g1_i1:136-2220(+)
MSENNTLYELSDRCSLNQSALIFTHREHEEERWDGSRMESSQKKRGRTISGIPPLRLATKSPFVESCYSMSKARLTPENLKNVEQIFEIDAEVTFAVDRQLGELHSTVSALESQFDVCASLSRKFEEQFRDVHQIMKGEVLSKVCKKDPTKSHQRLFYYCPVLEALTWKSLNNIMPKDFQLIKLRDIIQINGNVQNFCGRKKLTPAAISRFADVLLTIESRKCTIDLVCPNTEIRNKWLKALNLLICEGRSKRNLFTSLTANCENPIAQKTGDDFQRVRTALEEVKHKVGLAFVNVKRHYFECFKNFLKKERERQSALAAKMKALEAKLDRRNEKKLKLRAQLERTEHDLLEARLKISDLTAQNTLLSERNTTFNDEISVLFMRLQGLSKSQTTSVQSVSRGSFCSSRSPSPDKVKDFPRPRVTIRDLELAIEGLIQTHRDSPEDLKAKLAQREQDHLQLSQRFATVLEHNTNLMNLLKDANESIAVERARVAAQQTKSIPPRSELRQPLRPTVSVPDEDDEGNVDEGVLVSPRLQASKQPFQQQRKTVDAEDAPNLMMKLIELTEINQFLAQFTKVIGANLILAFRLVFRDQMGKKRPSMSLLDVSRFLIGQSEQETELISSLATRGGYNIHEGHSFLDAYLKRNTRENNHIVKLMTDLLCTALAIPFGAPAGCKKSTGKENQDINVVRRSNI